MASDDSPKAAGGAPVRTGAPTAGPGGSPAVAWLALLAAAAAIGLSLHASRGSGGDKDAESEADLLNPKSIEGRINDLEGRLETVQNRVGSLEERLGKAEKAAELATAIARSVARPDPEGQGPKPAATGADAPVDDAEAKKAEEEKRVEGERILGVIKAGGIPEGGVYSLFQRARDIGILDKALAEMEKYAEAHPDDANPQVDLGSAYIVKLMSVPEGMERGNWSMKSLAACERALRLQPEHWDAQFLKGMNLSQWPAFLGRQPDAIKTFEKLIEQQERGASEPRYVKTYYQLGNTYRVAGNVEKARKVFERGLELYPDDKQLREQIELLDKK